MSEESARCHWAESSELMLRYHDEEWGVPVWTDDQRHFEFLVLESAQAGLSWSTILNRREGYRKAFAGFDAEKVAQFTAADVERLMQDPGIIRNRKKIESTIENARLFLELQAKHGSFCNWYWNFTGGHAIENAWTTLSDLPATTPLSDRMAKELKNMGFRFLGSTVVYAHMQSMGMVNDHLVTCPRYEIVRALGR